MAARAATAAADRVRQQMPKLAALTHRHAGEATLKCFRHPGSVSAPVGAKRQVGWAMRGWGALSLRCFLCWAPVDFLEVGIVVGPSKRLDTQQVLSVATAARCCARLVTLVFVGVSPDTNPACQESAPPLTAAARTTAAASGPVPLPYLAALRPLTCSEHEPHLTTQHVSHHHTSRN